MKTYSKETRLNLLGLAVTLVLGVLLLALVASRIEQRGDDTTASPSPAEAAVAELPESGIVSDPLTRIQAADLLVRYRHGAPLRLAYPRDPDDPGRDVAFSGLEEALSGHAGARDYAIILLVSDQSNFIANDFAAARVGRALQAAGFKRVEVLRFQDPASAAPPEEEAPVIP